MLKWRSFGETRGRLICNLQLFRWLLEFLWKYTIKDKTICIYINEKIISCTGTCILTFYIFWTNIEWGTLVSMKNRKNWVRLTYDGKNVKAFSFIFSTFTDDGKNIGFFSNFLYLKQTIANSEHMKVRRPFCHSLWLMRWTLTRKYFMHQRKYCEEILILTMYRILDSRT